MSSRASSGYGIGVGFVYRHALNGYSAMVPAAVLETLRADSRVAYVEADGVVRASTTQTGATWGLNRIDQAALPLSTTYTYTATGSGVTAYVIDTGIRKTHSQVGGRAVHGADTTTPLALTSDTTATATEPTLPERSAARSTASRRARGSSPCACSPAPASA